MPLAVNTTQMTTWAFLTGVINNVLPAADFMTKLLFPNERLMPTEVLELSYLDGGRSLAPFVTVNGEAKTVPGRTTRFANVTAPNISLKRPMQAYQTLLRRAPGTNIFVGSDEILTAYRQAIAEDVEIISNLIDNRLEWMACQMATLCKIDYTAAAPDTEGDKFDVTIPRPSELGGNTGVALSGNNRWFHGASYATEGSTSDPVLDFENIKFVMSKRGYVPVMVVMGREAARAFKRHSKVKDWLKSQLGSNIQVGSLSFQEQYTAQGALLVARDFCGMPVWEYSATYTDDAGAEQYFLDPEAVLFISTRATQNNVIYYGAIADHEAFENGSYMTKRFSKSWVQKTPSVRVQMATSRPLPFCRQPNGIYTLKPVSTA